MLRWYVSPLIVCVCAFVLGPEVLRGAEVRAEAAGTSGVAAPHQAAINEYCVACHNDRTKSGGLVLGGLDVADVGPNAEV